jgi:hypothetical protein
MPGNLIPARPAVRFTDSQLDEWFDASRRAHGAAIGARPADRPGAGRPLVAVSRCGRRTAAPRAGSNPRGGSYYSIYKHADPCRADDLRAGEGGSPPSFAGLKAVRQR